MIPFPQSVVLYPRWLKPQYGSIASLSFLAVSWFLPAPLALIMAAALVMYSCFGWGYQYAAGRSYMRGMKDAFDFARKVDSAFLEAMKLGLTHDEASAAIKEKLGVSEEPTH